MLVMKKKQLPDARDDSDRRLLSDVENIGWHVVGILGDDVGPPYAFTVGLYHTFEHPEVMIVGLEPRSGGNLLNVLADQIQMGKRFGNLESVEFADVGFPLGFRAVNTEYYDSYLGYALWFYRSQDFPVLQCVWPDKALVFPWDDDCDDGCQELQRLTLIAE